MDVLDPWVINKEHNLLDIPRTNLFENLDPNTSTSRDVPCRP